MKTCPKDPGARLKILPLAQTWDNLTKITKDRNEPITLRRIGINDSIPIINKQTNGGNSDAAECWLPTG